MQIWREIGILERWLHQPWSEVQRMLWTDFRRQLLVAVYWARKEHDSQPER